VSLLPALEGYVVPSKFYGALAAGRPIVFIGARDGELAQEIAACRCGITIDPHDAAGLAHFLRRLCCEPATARAMERNARVFFDGNFDTSHAISKWTALLDGMQAVR
jgi:glycosyltransferase involved in cell wall biosynthesis